MNQRVRMNSLASTWFNPSMFDGSTSPTISNPSNQPKVMGNQNQTFGRPSKLAILGRWFLVVEIRPKHQLSLAPS